MRVAQFQLLAQLSQDDGGGRHGHGPAQHQCALPGDTEPECDQHARGRGDEHLCAAHAPKLRTQSPQARRRDLQPDGEQQQHQADLGQRLQHHPGGGVGSKQHADAQVADHRRHVEPPQGAEDEDADPKQEQRLSQDGREISAHGEPWGRCRRGIRASSSQADRTRPR